MPAPCFLLLERKALREFHGSGTLRRQLAYLWTFT